MTEEKQQTLSTLGTEDRTFEPPQDLAADANVTAAAYDEGADPRHVTTSAAMAKLFATESAQWVVDQAVQLHGARALQRGHLLEHLYREVRAPRIYEGASELTRPEDQERIQNLVRSIQRDLPLYVAFMERAKVNQRLGNPVGVSYMSEASSMMRERMITSANTLFALTQRQVAVEMVRLNAPQWVPLSGLVAALLLLAGAQWWLWRTFRRRWNKGFVAATAAMVMTMKAMPGTMAAAMATTMAAATVIVATVAGDVASAGLAAEEARKIRMRLEMMPETTTRAKAKMPATAWSNNGPNYTAPWVYQKS